MGENGTEGINGIRIDTINSANGGAFVVTFEIPKELREEEIIAIRLESESSYYSYNWFLNETSDGRTGGL